ncbi:MAG: RluA family pseudouridine synthase [Treponemataceae bacterium]|nr:RluA family pseudouridine synthase [Treponemataceae bacterium]
METSLFCVDPALLSTCPCRLDIYASSLLGMSRSRLKHGIKSVTVDGKKAKLSIKLSGGEKVELQYEDPVPENILPEELPLDIIYEDENTAVINKSQGMVTHPAAGNWSGTLVNALLFHWGRSSVFEEAPSSNDPRRPGIVHRLDKDTSGVIITAKNKNSEDWLQLQFQQRKVRKVYIAIVKGTPPAASGNIKTQIIRDPKNRKRFTTSSDPSEGKFSWTQYRCIGSYGPYSLMKLRLKTGRTHQIRVHMRHIGCPILGDPIYSRKDPLFPDATLMLHARILGITLPGGEKPVFFKAPVPLRFKKVLKVLHEKWEKKKVSEGKPIE